MSRIFNIFVRFARTKNLFLFQFQNDKASNEQTFLIINSVFSFFNYEIQQKSQHSQQASDNKQQNKKRDGKKW